MSDDIHEIYAIKYGRHERKKAENYIGGDPHDGQEPIDYFVWAITGPQGSFVVDTGFDEAMAKKRGRMISKPIAEGLKAIDVPPDSVKNVIISHLHYDHCGNYDTFPNARFHVQDIEMAYATGRCMCHPYLRHPYDVEDVVGFVRAVYANRVAFHDGFSELAPGLTLHRVGGHSKGLQIVRVWTARGWVVVASDATHYYDNLEGGRPFPTVYSVGDMMEGFRTVRALADSPDHIIPGHDPQVMELYPPPSAELDGIAIRLDVAPCMSRA